VCVVCVYVWCVCVCVVCVCVCVCGVCVYVCPAFNAKVKVICGMPALHFFHIIS